MVAIRITGVTKSFGEVPVLRGIDLEIGHSEFVVFVGPSGCGKSTLLRVIAGLEQATSGDIHFDDRRITDVAPAKRGVAMVFQSYALYPHMTVAENMTMSLRLAGVPKPERRRRAEEVAKMLQLTPLLDRKPAALSGGQRQRVAIGRAIVRQPDVFLFDEPLSNLDAALRVETRVGITKLHRTLGNTMIYVTHDQVEAMTMADRIVILDQGRVAQVGTPLELYRRPANAFVAGFLGSPKMNFIKADEISRSGSSIRLKLASGSDIEVNAAATDKVALFGIRPEHLTVANEGPIAGTVAAVEHLGSETLIYVETSADTLIVKAGENATTQPGDRVNLRPEPNAIHLFAADGRSVAGAPNH
ncbi:ABC transporter ATP-binding protein [Kaistia granuli]|uniref:ABC transporter ATP-binding protein n=1 Tax=Kaistia granuli TaxID=363259 RepID=UPI0003725E21|nr:ABC transporter ATP-binding protein [Kaistia granuli]